MFIVYIDADACPVREEVYRVARRYGWGVRVVANAMMRIPSDSGFEMIVCRGFGVVDDWIAEHCGPGDVVITSDIPLAGRALDRSARVIDSKGQEFTESDIGAALAMRELLDQLRQTQDFTGGPSPRHSRDRSQFLSKLDELIVAVRKQYPTAGG